MVVRNPIIRLVNNNIRDLGYLIDVWLWPWWYIWPSEYDICDLESARGRCSNYTVKWHFNKDDQRCMRFWYGGCDGNANNFEDEDECNSICVDRRKPGKWHVVLCGEHAQCSVEVGRVRKWCTHNDQLSSGDFSHKGKFRNGLGFVWPLALKTSYMSMYITGDVRSRASQT